MKQIRSSSVRHQLIAAAVAACAAGSASAQYSLCGPLENNYGPYDYRGREGSKRNVESNHFDHGVETLTRRLTGQFGGDIAYTLRAFPNHYRALITLEKLAEKENADPPDSAKYTVECYYERALRFVPDDHVVRLLYANFLIRRKRSEDALKQIDYVVNTTRDNPLAQLNAGRLYLDLKQYEKALTQAHLLMSMGYDRPELRNELTKAGRWVDPLPAAASSPARDPASGAGSDPR